MREYKYHRGARLSVISVKTLILACLVRYLELSPGGGHNLQGMEHPPAPLATAGAELNNLSIGTSNLTESLTPQQPQWALVALAIIPVWIFTGNLLVLLSVIGQKNLRTLSNWVIASLAVTDFLLAITVVPLGTYQVVSIYRSI